MESAWSVSQIQEQIEQNTRSCEALLELLAEERSALKSRDMDEIERILAEKTEHLTCLENSAIQRSSLARKLAGKTVAENWNAILSELDDEQLKSNWIKLKTLLQLCKSENEINGKLLVRNHQVYARLLDIVCGQTAAPSLYTAKGSSSASGSSNIVGEA